LHTLLAEAGLRVTCRVEPVRYDPALLLPDPRLRSRLAAMDPVQRAALAESLAGNMAVHTVYCVRAGAPLDRADPFAPHAVPVSRDISGEDLARGIQPDGTIAVLLDGLRIAIALPSLAAPILRLVDGRRSVAGIEAALAERGIAPEKVRAAWRETFPELERINRLLLAAPAGTREPPPAPGAA
jgi:hypothetical protein